MRLAVGTRLSPDPRNVPAPDAAAPQREQHGCHEHRLHIRRRDRDLTKRFGARVAVDGVDLRIPAGSAFGYLGPNGAGKTTLIPMVLGLTSVTSGEVSILGHSMPSGRAEALARVGAIVEEPRFHHYLTGRQNLDIVAAARKPEAHKRIAGALDRVGLTRRADEGPAAAGGRPLERGDCHDARRQRGDRQDARVCSAAKARRPRPG